MDGHISLHPLDFVEVTLSGSRDIFTSFWFDSVYALRQGGGVSGRLRINRALTFSGDVSNYEHTYPTETTATQLDGSFLTAKRLDRIFQYGAGAEWQVNRVNGLSFRVAYIRRTSNFDTQEVEGLVVGSGYSAVF